MLLKFKHNDGNPISLEENDGAWEPNYTIEDVYNAWKLKQETEMSRSSITDKGSGVQPPKSEWFGYKYRVTPESSKLLQEAVFKDGGKWSASKTGVQLVDHPYLFVKVDGALSYCSYDEVSYFERHHLPEKQPPQSKKDFVVGKWYKCLVNTFGFLEGKHYRLGKVQGNLWFDGTSSYVSRGCFDINSESDYDPNTVTFSVGDKVEITSNTSNGNTKKPTFLTSWLIGDIVKIIAVCRNGKYTNFKCNKDGCDYSQELSQYQLKKVVAKDVGECKIGALTVGFTGSIGTPETYYDSTGKWVVPKEFDGVDLNKCILPSSLTNNFRPNDFSITKEDVNIMSNQNRVVSVKFFDDDAGLKAENSLVAEYQITTRVSDQMTISKVLLTADVAGDIALHNEVRAATVDLNILKNTGNKVFLMPVDFEDLRVEVRQV